MKITQVLYKCGVSPPTLQPIPRALLNPLILILIQKRLLSSPFVGCKSQCTMPRYGFPCRVRCEANDTNANNPTNTIDVGSGTAPPPRPAASGPGVSQLHFVGSVQLQHPVWIADRDRASIQSDAVENVASRCGPYRQRPAYSRSIGMMLSVPPLSAAEAIGNVDPVGAADERVAGDVQVPHAAAVQTEVGRLIGRRTYVGQHHRAWLGIKIRAHRGSYSLAKTSPDRVALVQAHRR